MPTQNQILGPASILATFACFVSGINLNLVLSFFSSHAATDKIWVIIAVLLLLAFDLGYSAVTCINVYTREVIQFNYDPSVPIYIIDFIPAETVAPLLSAFSSTISQFMFGYQIYWNKKASGECAMTTYGLLCLGAITSMLNLSSGIAVTILYIHNLREANRSPIVTLWSASGILPNLIISYLLLSSTNRVKLRSSTILIKLRHYLLNCNTLTSIVSIISFIFYLVPATHFYIALFNKLAIVSILSALNSRDIQPFATECRCHRLVDNKTVQCEVEQITMISGPTQFDDDIEHEKRRASMGLDAMVLPKASDMGLGLDTLKESTTDEKDSLDSMKTR